MELMEMQLMETGTIDYSDYLLTLIERADQMIYILLVFLGFSVGLLVIYLLYKVVHNFMTY